MKQKILAFFSLVTLLSVSPAVGWAQSPLQASQNFEGTAGSIPYTGNPTIASFTTPNNGTPKNTPAFKGTKAWNVLNTSGQPSTQVITFQNVIFRNTSTNNYIQFNLAALASVPNQGLDIDDNVKVELSADYGATFYTAVTVVGSPNKANGQPGNGVWTFAGNQTAIGSFNGSLPASTANNTFTPTGTDELTPAGYGTVRINLTNVRNVVVRISLVNTDNNELWAVDDFGVYSTAPVVLPVTLTSFSAKAQPSGVMLNWTTATEVNNAYFEVQRSADGQSFAAIGKVQGSGTTSTGATYSFSDTRPVASLTYYRLRQVDMDGTEAFSAVVTVAAGSGKPVATFYPNPGNTSITLPNTPQDVQYRLYTATGRTVLAGRAAGGTELDVQRVPAGLYFLELITDGHQNVQRFVRQ